MMSTNVPRNPMQSLRCALQWNLALSVLPPQMSGKRPVPSQPSLQGSQNVECPRRRPKSKKPEIGIEISYESVSTKPTQRIKFDPWCCELGTQSRLWQRPKPVEPIRWRSMKIQAPNQLFVKIGCGRDRNQYVKIGCGRDRNQQNQ